MEGWRSFTPQPQPFYPIPRLQEPYGKSSLQPQYVNQFNPYVRPNVRRVRVRPGYKRQEEACNGVENLIHDIEIVSLLLGIASLVKGITSLLGSALSLLFTKFNVYFVNLPSRLLTILRRLGQEVPENLENVFSSLEILFAALEALFLIPFEQLNILIHFGGEALAVASLSLAGLTAFSDLWEHDLERLLGRRAARFIEQYGCNNPFSPAERLLVA